MAQLTLQVDSPSVLEQLKNVLSLMRGVKVIKAEALDDVPNAATLSAMKEAEAGNDAGLVDIQDLEHFMASME